jgi:hypothetical protein
MDAIALLSSDHRKIRILFGQYRRADTDRRRHTATDILIRELSKHVAAEETVFYPYAAKVLEPEAVGLPCAISSALKRDLAVLDGHRTAHEDDAMSMEQLERDLAAHIDEDEQKLMPRLRTSCDPGELNRLGARLDRAVRAGPTHPHPSASSGTKAAQLTAPFTAMYDRLRDRFRGRPTT